MQFIKNAAVCFVLAGLFVAILIIGMDREIARMEAQKNANTIYQEPLQ